MRKFLSLLVVLLTTFTSAWAGGGTSTYLCFTAEEAGSKVTFSWDSGSEVQTSTDGTSFNAYTAGTTITLEHVGDKVYFKGTNVTTNDDHKFTMSGKIAASGDVTSLTNGTGGVATLTEYCYESMFDDCTSLTAAPKLPATTLKKGCYYDMFGGCTSLTTAPELPVQTLAEACYEYMFNSCTSLTTAPALPATTLAKSCYEGMFGNCTNLIVNTAGPGTEWNINATSAENALKDMFKNSGGTFTGMPENNTTYYIASLPAVKLNSKGYATYSSDKPFKVNTKQKPTVTVDVKAYKAKVNGEQIALTEIPSGTSIPAGKGILLYTNDANSIGFAHFQWVSDGTAITDNDLKPTTKSDGTLATYETAWVLGDENLFLKYTGTAFIANRAYIPTTVHPIPSPGAKGMTLVFGDETTGITSYENETLRYENENRKYMENGRIVILKNGKKFNAAGQQIN